MCPQVMAPGGSRSGCSQSPAACYLLCQPPAGVQQASYTILHVLTWSSVRGGLSGTPPPQISSASETMWFSQVCGPFSGGRAFMFSKDKLSLVRTGGEDRDSGQNRCFRGRHQQLVQVINSFPVTRKKGEYEDSLLFQGAFRDDSENQKVSCGYCTQKRSFCCEFQPNRKQVQKGKVLCRLLQEVRERSRKRNQFP